MAAAFSGAVSTQPSWGLFAHQFGAAWSFTGWGLGLPSCFQATTSSSAPPSDLVSFQKLPTGASVYLMSSEGSWSKILNFERISVNCCGKMMAIVRGLVSKSKRRFRENGFDLDLSYITPRTIVMGFPAEGREGLFRNPLQEVMRFLTTYHDRQFKIINLCAERDYDHSKLGGNVERIPFEDHQPAPLNVILQFCEIAEEWLSQDENNVLAIHCKAGKGRAGLMMCCYLLYTKYCPDPLTALQFYADKRTTNGQGVTIPSQRRYVGYFYELIEKGPIPGIQLELAKISFTADIPSIKGIQVVVSSNHGNGTCKLTKVLSTLDSEVTRSQLDKTLILSLQPTWIAGDVKVEFLNDSKAPLFYFWLNTAYVRGSDFSISRKEDLDKPPKTMKSNIQVSLLFTGSRPAENSDNFLLDACQKIIPQL